MIKSDFYQYPALLPPLTWQDPTPPLPPTNVQAVKSGTYLFLNWEPVEQFGGKSVFYNVYRSENGPIDITNVHNLIAARIPDLMLFVPVSNSVESGYYYAVTSYDRYHNESPISDPVYFVTGDFEK
jgi:hypothetical protein